VTGRLKVHGLVENEVLLSRIAEHDIGFCGEPKFPANKNLTISNKFFQYLQAGLAVIASETAGQKEAAKEAGEAVFVFPLQKPGELRVGLEQLFNSPELLHARKQESWAAGSRLSWEAERLRNKIKS